MPIAFGVSAFVFSCFSAGGAPPHDLLPNDPDLNQLSWMVGSWYSESKDRQVDEHWTHPSGGSMMGVHRDVSGGKTVFYEFLRIEKRADGIFYVASPKGRQPPTEFKLGQSEARRAVFENPNHDYPQRVIYWLGDDGALHARIEGQDGQKTKSSEWSWKAARLVAQGRP